MIKRAAQTAIRSPNCATAAKRAAARASIVGRGNRDTPTRHARHLRANAHHVGMAVIEAWLLGGPADGRLMPVEVPAGGHPPEEIDLPQTGVYVGRGDAPAPTVIHRHMLSAADAVPVEYRYGGAVPPTP
jgi:hypothetical protein